MIVWGRVLKSLKGWIPVVAVAIALQMIADRGIIGQGSQPPDVNGLIVKGGDFLGLQALDKPAIVYFWASWCGICKAMQSEMARAAKEYPFISVAVESGDIATVKAYMNLEKFDVPAVLDERGYISRSFGIRGVPAIFIIGNDGNIRFASTGFMSDIGLRFRLWLAAF